MKCYIIILLLVILTGCSSTSNKTTDIQDDFKLTVCIESQASDEFRAWSTLEYTGSDDVIVDWSEHIYMYIYDTNGKKITSMNYFLSDDSLSKEILVSKGYHVKINFQPDVLDLKLEPGSYQFIGKTDFNIYSETDNLDKEKNQIILEAELDFIVK